MSKTKQPTNAFARKPCVIATGLALSLMAAQSVYAQQAAAPADAPQKAEKIEVTGTRIPPPNLEGASPVTVIDAQSIKVDGLRSVENLLNNLPQVFADQGGNVSNGASGTATVNLRNLGSVRTLVLVNGRRLPPGSPNGGAYAPDLNQIPAPLIKRVEILTGGAGAVYGSDAVAGVVNFIMNDRFEGVQVEANQSFYNHQQQNPKGAADLVNSRAATNAAQFKVPGDKSSDGRIYDANILMGSNFANGKGNATVFFSYKKEDALLQSERDFSSCSFGTNAAGDKFTCGGSSTSFPGRFFILSTGKSRTVTNDAGNTRAFSAATDQFNFAPYNFFQRPSERYSFNASANYDLTDNAKLYSEFSFHDDHTVAQIAPSGLFFGGATFNIKFENPLLSSDFRRDLGLLAPGDNSDIFVGRRNIEGGGRQDDIRHTSFRTVLGVKGEFAKVWNYDAFMQTSKVIYQETYKNDFSNVRAVRALDVVVGPNGTPVCRSVVDGSDPNCVPYNIFRLGGVSSAALNYVQTPGFKKGATEQTVQGGSVSADLGAYGLKLPTAKNGIGVAFGIERRVEKLQLDTDVEFTTGDLAGQGGPTIGLGGKYTVKEVYGEVRAPLIEGAQFAHLLSINGSARHSDYSTNQKTNSYGVGVEWAPVPLVRTRGSYQRAVRAANVNELFTAQANGLYDNDADPCGPSKTATFAQCQRTGITAATYGAAILDSPAGQYNALFGGNPQLKPESSDSKTLGIVIEPIKNMSMTLDYFDIKVKDVVGNLPPTQVLTQCLTNGKFCDLIFRDSIGSLWAQPSGRIVAVNQNLGKLQTSGLDIGFNYSHKLEGYGSVGVNLIGTYLRKLEVEAIPGAGVYDCKGLYGPTCGTPSPKWRSKLRGTWTTPWDVDLSLTWRHMDSVDISTSSSNPLLSGTVASFQRTLGAQEYFDFAASWAATKQLTLRGGVNNLTDKDPPLSALVGAGFGNGNTYPQVYDALGRRIFLNATFKF